MTHELRDPNACAVAGHFPWLPPIVKSRGYMPNVDPQPRRVLAVGRGALHQGGRVERRAWDRSES